LARQLKKRPGGARQVTVAPTGVAALNSGSQTINSFFRFPPRILDARNLDDGWFSEIFRHMDRLIVDEISMVRPDVLDAIDARLRQTRDDSRPFGGVQVVMVGDFLQLGPVVQEPEIQLLWELGYATPYAYSAHVLRSLPCENMTLSESFRQNDPEFITILNCLRVREYVDWALWKLNAHCVGPHRTGVDPLILTPTRNAAERHNPRGLTALTGARKIYQGRVEGEFGGYLPAQEYLELAAGARVMTVCNDQESRFVNGSRGTVITRTQPCRTVARAAAASGRHPRRSQSSRRFCSTVGHGNCAAIKQARRRRGRQRAKSPSNQWD
jgi:ATP-dependent DNA helicase PIF1